jgi:hypothetical protein
MNDTDIGGLTVLIKQVIDDLVITLNSIDERSCISSDLNKSILVATNRSSIVDNSPYTTR